MGFVYQTYPIVGGTVLIIERVESQNYAAGVAGWAIMADGSAEFANLIARGSLIGGLVVINGTAYPNAIALYTDNPSEVEPATIEPSGSIGNVGILQLNSPKLSPSITPPAQITLNGFDDGHGTIEFDSDNMRATLSDAATIEALPLRLSGDFTTYLSLATGVLAIEGETWKGTGVTPLAGTWVDTAGSRFGYVKDATGRVQVRGRVSGGGAGATIVTFPAGYRPSSNLDFSMRSGTTLCGVSVSTAGVLTVTANLATASAGGINLDVISFPTL